jgi:hypothetical protein
MYGSNVYQKEVFETTNGHFEKTHKEAAVKAFEKAKGY